MTHTLPQPILMNSDAIKTVIPHRFPLLLVDNVHELVLEKKIIASRTLNNDDPVFQGHFPEKPVYPGVYYIEGIAQTAAILIFKSYNQQDKLNSKLGVLTAVEQARFRRISVPGEVLVYETQIIKSKGPFFWIKGTASVNSEIAAEVELSLALRPDL